MPSQDWLDKDFYAALGVPPDVSAEVLKKTYRKLARKHHPDANGGAVASEARFKEIGEAYSVLSDPEQRSQYDQVRAISRGGARFTAGGPGGGAGFDDLFGGLFGAGSATGARGARQSRFTSSYPGGAGAGGSAGNLDDVLNAMFAGAGQPNRNGPAGFRSSAAGVRGDDLAAEVEVTFRQAVEGAQLTVRVPDGSGQRTVQARMPAGVKDGQKVRLPGKGRPSPTGAQDGDLVITVRVSPDSVFTLDGADLRVTLPVTFVEAALGTTVEAPTFDGSNVRVKLAAGTASGTVLRVRGRGVVTRQRTGDLLVTVQVLVPQRLDVAARKALEDFAVALGDEVDPRAELLARARAGQT